MQKETKLEQSFITQALWRTRRALWFVLLFSLCTNLLLLALPIYSLQMLDRVISSASIPTLINLTIIIVILLGFYGIFTLVRSSILARLGEWLESKISSRILEIGIAQNSIGSPSLSSQHLRDLQNIKSFIAGTGISTLCDAPWSIIFIMVIYVINPVLGFVAVLGGILLFGLAVLNELITRKPFHLANRVSMKTMEMADTASRNAEAIEAMGMMGNVLRRWSIENDRAKELQVKALGRASLLMSVSRVVRMLLQVMTTGIGAYLAINNEISVGGMIASSILIGRALAPFEAAIGIWKGFVGARESYRRLERSVASFPSLRGNMRLPAPTGRVSVENVVFAPQNNKHIIKGISFEIEPGEMVGIIGPSAAGKSTLAKLLIGILPPTSGAVRLDGAEVFKWNKEFLGEYVGYMPQNVDLFPGTVLDNIARMEEKPSQEKVIQAAQLASVHEMILRLPEGYETEIRPGNVTLSPGQRQRIGLARALYGSPKFLVLDEPNINLDGEGEQALMRAIHNIKGLGITTVIVAHRPTLVNSTHKVLIMHDGRIKEFGHTNKVLGKYVAPAISEAGGV